MVIKMSDYLLEQEISTASCDDILLEQAAAELEVAGALVEAYAKAVVMFEYASEVYQEGELKEIWGNKDYGFLKKLWESLKAILRAIGRFFGGLWNKAKGLKEKASTAIKGLKKAKNLPEEERKEIAVALEGISEKVRNGDSDVPVENAYNLEDYKLIDGNVTTRSKGLIDAIEKMYTFLNNIDERNFDGTKISAETEKQVEKLRTEIKKYDHLAKKRNKNYTGKDRIIARVDTTLDKYINAISYFQTELLPRWEQTSRDIKAAVDNFNKIDKVEALVMTSHETTDTGAKVDVSTNVASELNKYISTISKEVNAAATSLMNDIKEVLSFCDYIIKEAIAASTGARNASYQKKANAIAANAKPSNLTDEDIRES